MSPSVESLTGAAQILAKLDKLEESDRTIMATLGSLREEVAEIRGATRERRGDWTQIREMPAQVADLRARLRTLEDKGATVSKVLDALIGEKGFLRTTWGIVIIAAGLLAIGAAGAPELISYVTGAPVLPDVHESHPAPAPELIDHELSPPALGASLQP